MKPFAILAAVPILSLATTAASLAEQGNSRDDAEKAVRKLSAQYIAAFNKGDAKSLAALWTPTGDYIGPRGKLMKGRDELAKNFARFFAENEQVNLTMNITSIRFLGDDVAILDGIPDVTPPLQGPPVKVRSTVVFVKQADQWLIATARDSLTYLPSHYDHLKQLEWMIGDWVDAAPDSDDVSIESTCDWTVNKNFIIRKFSAEVKGDISVAGTQLIGWDPRENRIRSWVFDSGGGFSEGFWGRDGHRWIVESSGVLHDGSEVSSTNVLTRIDDDMFTFESRNRVINGQASPDIGPVEIKRQPLQTVKQDKPGIPKKPARETVLPQ